MNRILAMAALAMLVCVLTGCGDDKPLKPASGGGGSTSPATIKPPPKGNLPKME